MKTISGKYGTVPFFYNGQILSSIPITEDLKPWEIEKGLEKYTNQFIISEMKNGKKLDEIIFQSKFNSEIFYEKRFINKKKTTEDEHAAFLFSILTLIKTKNIDNDLDHDGYIICKKKIKNKNKRFK
jgi:hypothetical protein